jgi:hypothetical protein
MVTVDGKPQGTTPVAIRGLELGTHRVAVSQPGYRPVERQVALTSARPSRAIEIELPPATRTPAASTSAPSAGRLVVDSRPGAASVFIDGRRVGVTPLLLDVATGPHTVRLERDGYRTVTTRVEVKAGERARVAARLEGGQDEE